MHLYMCVCVCVCVCNETVLDPTDFHFIAKSSSNTYKYIFLFCYFEE